MVEFALLMFCFLFFGRELYAADRSNGKPSIELLEFLGEWKTQDGQWFDPFWLSDNSKQTHQPEKQKSQQSQ